MTNNDLVEATRPRKNPSYSPNLHKWLTTWSKNHPARHTPSVWRDAQGMLRIGYQSRTESEREDCGFIGVRLNAVLCVGVSANRERGWFTNLGPGNMTEVEDFWTRYIAIGRCAIDTEHKTRFIGDDDRYTTAGDIRTCTWCGARHRIRIEVQTHTKEIVHHDPITTQPTTTTP
jgi:hypothetical protein